MIYINPVNKGLENLTTFYIPFDVGAINVRFVLRRAKYITLHKY